jgi:hypothetical protein
MFEIALQEVTDQTIDMPESTHVERIHAIMDVLGFQYANVFAMELGVSQSRLGNILAGKPLSKEVALKIVRKCPGMTLDWLFLGDPRYLPYELAIRLDAALRARKGQYAAG